MKKLLLITAMAISLNSYSQAPVGVLKNDTGTFEGYNLIAPLGFDTTYLVNNCGMIVNTWSSQYPPGDIAYIDSTGNLWRAGNNGNNFGIAAGGDTEKERVLEIINKQNATWPQRLDKGKDATVSYHALYKIASLPTVWLLNKDGKIVDRNARGIRLEPLIRTYLGLDKS